MELNNKIKLLKIMGQVYEQARESKLDPEFLEKIDHHLEYLSGYFHTTKNQALFIAIIFALNYKGGTVDLNDLINYFDCNPMKILEFSDDFDELKRLKILVNQKSRHRVMLEGNNDQFTINEKLSGAILKNQPMPLLEPAEFKNVIECLETIAQLMKARYDEESETIELFIKVSDIIESNSHFALFAKILGLELCMGDQALYAFLIWKTISGKESVEMVDAMEYLIESPSERVCEMQSILNGTHKLIELNLIELVEASFFTEAQLKLTGKSKELASECGLKLFNPGNRKGYAIDPSTLPARELVFDEKLMKQLFMLKDMLRDENLVKVKERLAGKGLSEGVNVLFYGVPGTGKTESVLQMARETGREVVKVDISKSKSMWFGESEKTIKKIFTDYREYAAKCKSAPILLFNEADAIFSRRKDITSSSVAQTENAIQNIILEEMETFDGILIATTNLTDNLDKAFERRFLFKIRFHKPTQEERARIWKMKFPSLADGNCHQLASRYHFTGGQIDNIVRKAEVTEIIHGVEPTLDAIIEFCNEELIENKSGGLGFGMR